MKHKLLAILAVGLMAGPLQALAIPIDYSITFVTLSGDPAPVSGAFTYDSTAPEFTNFTVKWNGTEFDLTDSANSPTQTGSACGYASGAAGTFALLSNPSASTCLDTSWTGSGSSPLFAFISYTDPFIERFAVVAQAASPVADYFANDVGTWSVQPVGVPEPHSLGLLALGLAGLGFARRRGRQAAKV